MFTSVFKFQIVGFPHTLTYETTDVHTTIPYRIGLSKVVSHNNNVKFLQWDSIDKKQKNTIKPDVQWWENYSSVNKLYVYFMFVWTQQL